MRGNTCTAMRAIGQLLGFLVMMSPTLAGSRIGMTSLWNCHDKKLKFKNCDLRP